MNSIAIVRATDILKLKSTLLEMSRAGLNFEGQPKEINPASVEKALSKISDGSYRVCALISILQDYESLQGKIKSLPRYSDVTILGSSHELFKNFAKLIPVLPDLDVPKDYIKDPGKQPFEPKGRPSPVYLGIFVDRKVHLQTGSGAMYTGILRHADSIGVFFEPSDNSAPVFITWHDIKKIIIPKEETK